MPDNQDCHKGPPKPQTAHRSHHGPVQWTHIQAGCLGPMPSLVDPSQDSFSEQQSTLPHFSLEASLASTSQVCSPGRPIPMSLSFLFRDSTAASVSRSLAGTSSLVLSPLLPTGHQPPSQITAACARCSSRASFSHPISFPHSYRPGHHQSPHPGFSCALKLRSQRSR